MTDEELIDTCRDFRAGLIGPETPGEGMCAAVCWPLAGFLSSLCGINVECFETDLSDHPTARALEHVWMRLPDGRALDPTFDQFGGADIYLGTPTQYHKVDK